MFDENKSWYVKENIRNQTLSDCTDTDADVYDSNVIYSKFTSPTTSLVRAKQVTGLLQKYPNAKTTVERLYLHLIRTDTNLVKREVLVKNSAAYQQRSVDNLLSILISICQDLYPTSACIFRSRRERHHVPRTPVCHLSNTSGLLARGQRGHPEGGSIRLLHGKSLSASGGLPICPHALPHERHDRLHGA